MFVVLDGDATDRDRELFHDERDERFVRRRRCKEDVHPRTAVKEDLDLKEESARGEIAIEVELVVNHGVELVEKPHRFRRPAIHVLDDRLQNIRVRDDDIVAFESIRIRQEILRPRVSVSGERISTEPSNVEIFLEPLCLLVEQRIRRVDNERESVRFN